jgi:NitT/TauT family transport system substrate-binding protein
MFKRTLVLALVLALGISTVGCNQKTTPISMGTSPYPAWYVWYIAEEEGMFKKAGLDVKLVYFPVYSDSLQAFNTGKIDMLNIATCDTIAPYNSGIDFKIILINDNSNGADGLVAKQKYATIADLKGQKVVTEYGTIEHFFLLKALEHAGLSADDIQYTNMTVNDSGTAMVAGTVEAACVWEPSLTIALNKGVNRLLYSSAETPGLIPDLVIVNGKLLKNNRDDLLKIMQVWYDCLEFYNENPEKAVADMAKHAEVSVPEMKQMMAGSKLFSIQDNLAAMTQKQDNYAYLPYTITETAKFLKSVKMVDDVPANPDDLIDSSLMKELSKTREDFPAPDTKALAGQ